MNDEYYQKIAEGVCPRCGERLLYEGGCAHCPSCGFSVCGND